MAILAIDSLTPSSDQTTRDTQERKSEKSNNPSDKVVNLLQGSNYTRPVERKAKAK
jgi:hypothetical protein